MKKFALGSVATVVGLGAAGGAMAQVNLDGTKAADIKSLVYAAEQVISSSKKATLTSAGEDAKVKMAIGVGLSTDAIGYLRFDLNESATFKGEPTVSCGAAADTVVESTAVAGIGKNSVIFGLAPKATTALTADITCTLTPTTGVEVSDQKAVTIQGRFFETLTNATNPTLTNALNSKSQTYASFSSALSFSAANGTAATADVESKNTKGTVVPYVKFTATSPGGQTAANLGTLTVIDQQARLASGALATYANIVKSSSTVVSGDFSFVKKDGTKLDPTQVTFNGTAASAVTSSSATFANAVAGDVDPGKANQLKILAVEGETATIGKGTYAAGVTFTANDGFTLGNLSAQPVGQINLNGTTLVAPFLQNGPNYLTRLAVYNNGSEDRTYTLSVVGESGVTVTVDPSIAQGTIKKNSSTVIDFAGLLTTTSTTNANPRGALSVIINAPAADIEATYQMTHKTNGSVTNQTVIKK